MKLEKIVAFSLILVLFLIACRKAPVPPAITLEETPGKEKEATLPAGQPWEIKWEKVKEAAKKEGRVRWYSSMEETFFRDQAIKIMKEKFGLSLEVLAGRSAQIDAKIMAERRAGLYLADVHMGGVSTFVSHRSAGVVEPLKPLLILPEVTDPDLIKKIWRGG